MYFALPWLFAHCEYTKSQIFRKPIRIVNNLLGCDTSRLNNITNQSVMTSDNHFTFRTTSPSATLAPAEHIRHPASDSHKSRRGQNWRWIYTGGTILRQCMKCGGPSRTFSRSLPYYIKWNDLLKTAINSLPPLPLSDLKDDWTRREGGREAWEWPNKGIKLSRLQFWPALAVNPFMAMQWGRVHHSAILVLVVFVELIFLHTALLSRC